MGYIKADREQNHILGYSLSDFVEKDSKARFIVDIVDKLDTKALYSRYSNQGGEAYHPKIMLAIWFLGYCESVTTTRKLEYNCKKNLDFIYISANLQPDHTSLSRFRQRHLDLIPQYFVEIIKLAQGKGLSNFKQIAIDGTKLPAISSKKRSMKEKELNKYIESVELDISRYIEELNKEDKEYTELIKRKNKLEKAKIELKKRQEEIRKDFRETHQVNIEEPEACMFGAGIKGGSYSGYNAQVSTDTETQIIVATEVVQDRNDEKQFLKQHTNIVNNLSEDKERIYIADSGYNSNEQLDKLSKKDIQAYIADRYESRDIKEKIEKGISFTKGDFKYNPELDCYICPIGERLEFIRKDDNKSFKGNKYKKNGCTLCKLKTLCLRKTNKTGSREIRRDYREVLVEAMKKKMSTEIAKNLLLKRSQSVETAIGNIKSNMGYSRFRLKGLDKVNAEFKLMCIGHNLNKLFKLCRGNITVFFNVLANIFFQNFRESFLKDILGKTLLFYKY